ncbi:hypothetical protein ACFVWX_08620 [Streptomyces sp. NPDC058220]|uniref:hypothetical protein n=1 Tax=unclassified Streptomyces TaxID=2593676 RepID=UPI00364995F3
MVRYVHHQLTGVTTAVCASAVGTLVAFSVRGIPAEDDSHGRLVVLFLFGLGALGALFAASPVPGIGEVRTFKAAMPLNDPEAVLPSGNAPVRQRLFSWPFLLMLLVPSLIAALFWSPWAALYPLPLSVEWLTRACVAARWERRHGLLLWRGEVAEQPLGKGQLLYTSVRPG